MASITMNHIVKKYGDGFPAVNDVSIDVGDGEFMILVGPSGCGKSTLLRMIVGLEDITDGDMIIGDRRVNDLAPRDRNLAMVFQNYALYPHLTVYENIAFPLRLAGAKNDEVDRKVREAAETLELTEHLDRKPSNLSGGQRQRVAMGRAIVRNADAFLFDEPLSNLDAKLRGQMRTEISRLQKRLGITTVYVTHDQIEAMTLGDRVAVLKRGVLQQLATPRELYDNPANLFVAGFIGSPPMNFLPATVEGTTLKLPFGEIQIPAAKAEKAAGKGLLIAGIRPENFAEAGAASTTREVSEENTFEATVDAVEWLGNETYAYIPFEAPPEVQTQLDQLAKDTDSEALRTQLIITLDGGSTVSDGDTVKIWMDGSKVHLFDPETSENLTVDPDRCGTIPGTADGSATNGAPPAEATAGSDGTGQQATTQEV
ncbi:ABC transporter ATP-binding protein [Nocardioides sp. KR10-350]|uniref:ABC transporter ATP-binding protein n=1 Tax=Nocardioides cheoyonin TaxID=3156615 RepID=UPI0032B4055B